ncbi:MAG: hypothetical protein KGZ25_07905 [Planctomycetes bacterium]|nr:hypothetical protein [Planctomycetota bacterium]
MFPKNSGGVIFFLFVVFCCAGKLMAEESKLTIPAKDFVGGCHSTFYKGDDAKYGEGYSYRGARKVSIFSRGVEGDSITARFALEGTPQGESELKIVGLDDVKEGSVPIRVILNGKVVHEGETVFKDSPHIYTPRGWTTQTIKLRREVFVGGKNTLTIENMDDGHDESLRWMFVHQAEFVFPEGGVKGKAERGEDFMGRQYLQGLVEPIVYPAALKHNTIHLIEDRFLQQGFTAMAEGKYNGRKIRAVIEIPRSVEALVVRGQELNRENIVRDKTPYQRLTVAFKLKTMSGRRIHYYGHPLLALKPDKSGRLPVAHVHMEVDGDPHPEKTFGIKVWPIHEEHKRPKKFSLGVWGASRPKDKRVASDYGELLRENGFALVFGTTNKGEAGFFHEHDIKYYTRFGPHHPSEKHPTVKWDGSTNPREADPLYLIYGEDAVQLPTFQRAIKAAEKNWLDGVCCDYELMADSWSERSILEFKKFIKPKKPRLAQYSKEKLRKLATDPETGRYSPFPEWQDYRRWLNARIVGRMQDEIHKIRPDMPYLSLASASDMPCYWWNAGGRGRFRLEDLVREVDQVACSVYHYDNPGGLPSIPEIVRTANRFSGGNGAEMHLIGIFAGTLIELYRYDKVRLPAWAMRLDIVLAGAEGGNAFHFFRGDQLDGEYFSAASRALHELATLEPLLMEGKLADERVRISFPKKPDYKLARSSNHTFGSKLLWAGGLDKQKKAMLRLLPDGRMLLLLFNFMDVSAKMNVTIQGALPAKRYELKTLLAGEKSGSAVVSPAEGFIQNVSSRDLSALLLSPTDGD